MLWRVIDGLDPREARLVKICSGLLFVVGTEGMMNDES